MTGLSGIGLAVAKLLHEYGAILSLADIDQNALSIVHTHLNSSPNSPDILIKKVDISVVEDVNTWIAETIEKFGRLDGAANMAGVIGKHHGIRDLVDQDESEWDFIMKVNLTGTMHCMRAQLRAMMKENTGDGNDKRKGTASIVNAASIQGLKGFPKHAAYSASKHGVIGLTKSVAQEVAPAVRVNCVAP